MVWVDDILSVGHTAALDKFEKELKAKYRITAHKGDRISYLGLDIVKQEDGGYVVSSPGTRQGILHKFEHLNTCKKGPVTPMTDDGLKKVGTGTPFEPC